MVYLEARLCYNIYNRIGKNIRTLMTQRTHTKFERSWLDFTGHSAACDGCVDTCPSGWLAIYGENGLVQPYDRAYKCQVSAFVSSRVCSGARKFWQYSYPDIRVSCIEPRELVVRREITQMAVI